MLSVFHSVPHGIKEICSDVKESPGQLHPKDHEMMELSLTLFLLPGRPVAEWNFYKKRN